MIDFIVSFVKCVAVYGKLCSYVLIGGLLDLRVANVLLFIQSVQCVNVVNVFKVFEMFRVSDVFNHNVK